jgi:ferricrocin synthase
VKRCHNGWRISGLGSWLVRTGQLVSTNYPTLYPQQLIACIETGICCAIRLTTPETKSTVIGSPLPSITFSVLSKDTAYLTPRLGIGELHIDGPQLSGDDYHTDYKLPQSRATYSDTRRVPYKSGDVVRMLGNGYFEYIGRTVNIDLNEINDALKAGHPDITGVATLAIEDSKDEIVSFLAVPKSKSFEGFSSESDYRVSVRKAVQSAVREKLPTYMIPKGLVTVSNIPLSPSGKVDKRALISRFRQCQPWGWLNEGGSGDKPPPDTHFSKDENDLFDIFSHFSGVDRQKIGRDTTIYSLGLDSISAAQMASEIRNSGSIVTAADILEVRNAP